MSMLPRGIDRFQKTISSGKETLPFGLFGRKISFHQIQKNTVGKHFLSLCHYFYTIVHYPPKPSLPPVCSFNSLGQVWAILRPRVSVNTTASRVMLAGVSRRVQNIL
jgi:hypothetical protein